MPKRHQQRPAEERVGRNNPEKSTEITTGTPKRQETYKREAREHKNPAVRAQASPAPSDTDMTPELTHEGDSRRRMQDRERRSGSHSNANTPRKGSRLDSDVVRQPPPHPEDGDDFSQDLEESRRPDAGPAINEQSVKDFERSAYEIKGLYPKLADLTDDELKQISILPEGSRLEQGGRYIDLNHLENGEFVAMADMVAGPNNEYVSKRQTDYVLWNRLNQVSNPIRLDETT